MTQCDDLFVRSTSEAARAVIRSKLSTGPVWLSPSWITLWITLWTQRCRLGSRLLSAVSAYFHCVETPKPAAMKPKPTTMFQLPIDSTGKSPLVT